MAYCEQDGVNRQLGGKPGGRVVKPEHRVGQLPRGPGDALFRGTNQTASADVIGVFAKKLHPARDPIPAHRHGFASIPESRSVTRGTSPRVDRSSTGSSRTLTA